MNKKLPTIDIKGKEYVLVKDRVLAFNELYPNGAIVTDKISGLSERVEFKATVIPNVDKPERFFTGHSQAVWGDGYINKTSATENAETSAVGRALALMGIGVMDSIASADEIKKTTLVVDKIKNNETITPDEYTEALEYDYGTVKQATRESHAQKRQEYKTNKNAYKPEL